MFRTTNKMIAIALLATATFALVVHRSVAADAPAPSDQELTASLIACSTHKRKQPIQNGTSSGWVYKFDAGWEHCDEIEKAYEAAAPGIARRAREEFEEQNRQRSIETAKKLNDAR